MQEINAEYGKLFKSLKDKHKSKSADGKENNTKTDFNNHDFTTFIDDILAVGLAVLRYLLWHLILCLFRLFPSKWHKIPVAGFVR